MTALHYTKVKGLTNFNQAKCPECSSRSELYYLNPALKKAEFRCLSKRCQITFKEKIGE